MKTLRSRTGPFREQPFFKPGEIDRICVEALSNVGLYPTAPSPIRIERFIEKRFKVSPEYDRLAEGVLGYTRFGGAGVEAIVVAKNLDEEGTEVSERRVRTTLAHEAGHGLLHAHLFALGDNLHLFNSETDAGGRVLCRDVAGHAQTMRSYAGRWWEYQANQAIGGLLVPRALAEEALKPYLLHIGLLGQFTLDASQAETAARSLAETFQVNPAVTRIRIAELYPLASSGQLSL